MGRHRTALVMGLSSTTRKMPGGSSRLPEGCAPAPARPWQLLCVPRQVAESSAASQRRAASLVERKTANQRTSLPQQDSGSQRPQRHPESVRELRPGGGRRGRGRSRSPGHPRGAAQTVQGVGSEQGPRRHGPGAPGHPDPDGEPTPGGEGAPGRAARARGLWGDSTGGWTPTILSLSEISSSSSFFLFSK